VPVTIKEQFLVAGTPSTVGLPSRASHRAAGDGPLVGRLRQAGAIVLGKTNVSQLLIYHESDNPVYGRTNNPWDPQRTPGGSSGGEAAIVAAGGLGATDPSVPPVPWPDWRAVSLDGLRVAMYSDDGFFRPAPATRRAVHEAAAALRSHGAQVEEWSPPGVADAVRVYLGIASADGGAGYKRALGKDERDRRISVLLRAAGLPNGARPLAVRLLERVGQRHTARVVRSMARKSWTKAPKTSAAIHLCVCW
jgi:Asp-tRNA(Asn)/Glu-tRNA(Gln) amidotransferase A subunit family amidase